MWRTEWTAIRRVPANDRRGWLIRVTHERGAQCTGDVGSPREAQAHAPAPRVRHLAEHQPIGAEDAARHCRSRLRARNPVARELARKDPGLDFPMPLVCSAQPVELAGRARTQDHIAGVVGYPTCAPVGFSRPTVLECA